MAPSTLPVLDTWHPLEAEENGIANLARVAGPVKGADTMLAKVELSADHPVTIPVKFGYSDKVKVYLNGQLLYSGNNQYRSRDYRYLGTIGLFDELPLTLKKGKNTLSFAVSELFGGWGIMADLGPHEAVSIIAQNGE